MKVGGKTGHKFADNSASPLDGVLAASYDDSKENYLWNGGRYHCCWRRELHPTAKADSYMYAFEEIHSLYSVV